MEKQSDKIFINEVVLNAYTLQEIMLALWSYKKGRNKVPVILFLLVTISPLIYGFVTGKNEMVLLSACTLFGALIIIFTYVFIIAFKGKKERELKIQSFSEQYGKEPILQIDAGENLRYHFNGISHSVSYGEIRKLIPLEMYEVILLKNGVELPIWKVGFKEGEWDEAINFLKSKL